VIRYVAEKYGYDHVAQIITFGTLGAKAAIRDVGRALGMSYATVDRVARLVPNALHMTIDRAMNESEGLRQLYDMDPAVRQLVDTAKRLEGVSRHAGTHAAGVVMSSDPLIEHVPLQRPVRGDESSLLMTQYHMWHVAEIGLLKMDFLGLANLTILARAVELIKQVRGIDLDYNKIPDGDPKTYEMLAKGETFAVFQLESAGMRRHIQDLRPQNIAELAAMVALYRPGPMQHIPRFCRAKHGEEEIVYPHPDLAEILDETYGVITYQDQVLHIFRKFAGYSLGQADIVRKAMGKKIASLMKAERDRFIKGATERGYSEEDAAAVFDLIEPFAGYAFNKAHSVCYATVAYQTAYLKANYPAEYMTAVMMLAGSHPGGPQERIAAAYAECAKLDIPVLRPDVNQSQVNFAIEIQPDGRSAIRFGLSMIKNVGTGAAEAVVEARQQGGPFTSVEDFCRRVNLRELNKRALESMIKAGALDSLGDRGTLLHNLDRLVSLGQREQKLRESGQATMFDLFGQTAQTPLPALELERAEAPRADCLAWEKELMGVYVSEHPFTSAAKQLAPLVTAVCAEVTAEMSGRDLMLAGMVAQVRPLTTRDGRPFCAATLEDLSGSVEVTVWSDVYKQTEALWTPGEILLCQVRVRERDDRLNISVNRVARYVVNQDRFSLEGYDAAIWAQDPGSYRNGRTGNGHGNGNGRRPPAPAPLPEVVIESPPPAAETPDHDMQEGLVAASPDEAPLPEPDGDGVDVATAAVAVSTAAVKDARPAARKSKGKPAVGTPPRRMLRIDLRETPDQEGDRARLMSVLSALPDHPGHDAVRLIIHTLAGEDVEMELPDAAASDALVSRIRQALGSAGSVTVEASAGTELSLPS
jgi:DNA polymerase-3 subunit alpha